MGVASSQPFELGNDRAHPEICLSWETSNLHYHFDSGLGCTRLYTGRVKANRIWSLSEYISMEGQQERPLFGTERPKPLVH